MNELIYMPESNYEFTDTALSLVIEVYGWDGPEWRTEFPILDIPACDILDWLKPDLEFGYVAYLSFKRNGKPTQKTLKLGRFHR